MFYNRKVQKGFYMLRLTANISISGVCSPDKISSNEQHRSLRLFFLFYNEHNEQATSVSKSYKAELPHFALGQNGLNELKGRMREHCKSFMLRLIDSS
jgi:hypothetical protein